MSGTAAAFPGATALTGLRVYDWPTADGLAGGSAHIHLLSTEAYVVRSGAGRVETLSSNGFAVHDLAPGDVVWFTPGTVHRLVNLDHLELLVVMANAGLPEAGDAVMTFPPEVLADPDAYARGLTRTRRPDLCRRRRRRACPPGPRDHRVSAAAQGGPGRRADRAGALLRRRDGAGAASAAAMEGHPGGRSGRRHSRGVGSVDGVGRRRWQTPR
ncbi:MAG TPA: cupin domain-containing protein [Actinopolymorphaceae bacterium]